MPNKLLPLLTLPVLFLASCGGGTTPAPTPSPKTEVQQPVVVKDAGSQEKSLEEQSVLDQINAVRAAPRMCGDKLMPAAAPVTWNGYLATAARGHAQDMADNGYFGHESQDGRRAQHRIEAAGYTGWLYVGENIAAGYGPNDVLKGWLQSPSHCETLMDPVLTEVGVGHVFKPGSRFGLYWVSDFGSR